MRPKLSPNNRPPPPRHKRVRHNLGLLLDPIAGQRLARLELVGIPPLHRAQQRHIPPASGLGLPDVSHFVDEVGLRGGLRQTEIVAIGLPAGVKVQVSAGGHRHIARLEPPPLTAADRDCCGVDRRAEHLAHQSDLARRQRPFTADRAVERKFAQGLVPMPPIAASPAA